MGSALTGQSTVAEPAESWLSGTRIALKALTARGRALVAGGVTAAICGAVLGERDLIRIGILIFFIPVVTAVVASRGGQRLSLIRTVATPVVEVGQPTTVSLELGCIGRPSGLLLLEEQVPWALGQRPRFLIGRLAPGHPRQFEYSIRAEVRGRYALGPLLVHVADPFGILATSRSFPRTTTVVVVPAVESLPQVGSIGAWTGTGDNRPRPFTTGSAADSTVREYRLGDDLRRVHWPTTARTGELMVRREEQPGQASCTLFVDNRIAAHRGSGAESSLERAITVAASAAVHLSGMGYQVSVLAADGSTWNHHADAAGPGDPAGDPARPILEFLASLTSFDNAHITPFRGDSNGTGNLFVAVLGALDDQARTELLRAQSPGNASYAIVLNVESWAGRQRETSTPGSTHALRARGWKAVDLDRGGSLPQAWKELSR